MTALRPIVLAILPLLLVSAAVYGTSTTRVVLYAASGCSLCPDDPVREATLGYFSELTRALKEIGITDVQLKLIDMDSEAYKEMDQLYEKLGVPESMWGNIVVIIDEKYLFVHVPVNVVTDFLTNHAKEYSKIAVFRDPLHGTYKVMNGEGTIIECEIKNSITECLTAQSTNLSSPPLWSTLSLVAVSGLLDGINPCAFGVLLFLVTLMFARAIRGGDHQNQVKRTVLVFGSTYILGVYLTYLIIGLTLRQALSIVPFPHLVSKIGSLVVISLGIIKIKERFCPGGAMSLKLSPARWETIRKWMRKATLPATFFTGTLVAFFEFPCTGGIYLAILSVLAAKTTFLEGSMYLLLYNIAFILPLVAILFLSCKKEIVRFSLRNWQQSEEKKMKLVEGIVYIGLGAVLLLSVLV